MVYIPNPTDATQPTGNVDASTADDEFRALKAYVLGLALTAGMFMPVRQTVSDGFCNSSGDPAFLTAAAAGGLALDLKATGRPLVANFAGGSTGTGVNDRNGTYTGDTANVVTGLPANTTNFIYADYISQSAWTWGSTLAQPQYNKAYDISRQALLQFAGAAGSTTFLDDNGTTWTAQGGAKVQTNQIQFGTGALGGAGALNALNGAADYIKTAAGALTINSLGGWSIRAWARPTVLPGAATAGDVISIVPASNFGARLIIFNNAGTIKFAYCLSSLGAANDIANFVQGTTTPVINTTYFVELTFDPLGNAGGGTYRLYVNGAQESSTNSASRVHNASLIGTIGSCNGAAGSFFTGYIDKPEFLPYCQHPNGTAYAVPTAAPSISAAGYAPDYFDIQAMKMYSVTAPSAAAGTPPTLTSKYRLYLGETDCSGVIPTAVRNYALNGKYTGNLVATLPGISTSVTISHNIGVKPERVDVIAECIIADSGYSPGEQIQLVGTSRVAAPVLTVPLQVRKTALQAGFSTSDSNASVGVPKAGGSIGVITGTSWMYKFNCARGWGGA